MNHDQRQGFFLGLIAGIVITLLVAVLVILAWNTQPEPEPTTKIVYRDVKMQARTEHLRHFDRYDPQGQEITYQALWLYGDLLVVDGLETVICNNKAAEGSVYYNLPDWKQAQVDEICLEAAAYD
jgi:hypothetical protein